MTMDATVRISDFSYAYPDAADYTLRNIDLEIRPGECHCVSGPTGSGKTTLALAMKGLLPPGRQSGTVSSAGSIQGRPLRTGLVLQNPETQILRSTIGAEGAFGLENLCIDPRLMPGMVEGAVATLGLDKPLSFRSDALSMGQKYRLLVASHLVMNPHLLILDEPAGQLDPDGTGMLAEVILGLKAQGVSFVLCENRPEVFADVIDFFWRLGDEGTLEAGTDCPAGRRGDAPYRLQGASGRKVRADQGEELVSVRDLGLSGYTGHEILSSVTFDIVKGQRVLMSGMNGSGKTSLLRCILGFMRPASGEVLVFSERPVPGNLQGRVGCLFQNPQRQIFETSVFDEVSFPLRRLGAKVRDLAGKVRETLQLCSIEGLSDLSPHKLSYGQKHLVALACALVHDPELLVLDDPFAGLDSRRSAEIMKLLISVNEDKGTTIIWTSHEPGAMNEWAHLLIDIGEGHAETRG